MRPREEIPKHQTADGRPLPSVVEGYSYAEWPGVWHICIENLFPTRSSAAIHTWRSSAGRAIWHANIPELPGQADPGYSYHWVQIQLDENTHRSLPFGNQGGTTWAEHEIVEGQLPAGTPEGGSAETRKAYNGLELPTPKAAGTHKRNPLSLDEREALCIRAEIRRWRRQGGEDWLGAHQIAERVGRDLRTRAKHIRYVDDVERIARWVEQKMGTSHRESPNIRDLLHRFRNGRNGGAHYGTDGRRLDADAQEVMRRLEEAIIFDLPRCGTVGSLMETEVVTARRNETVQAVKDRMLKHEFSAMPIEPSARHGWEWVTAAAIAAYAMEGHMHRYGLDTEVDEFERREAAEFISEDAPLSEAAQRMAGQPGLLVGDEGNLRGILTEFDILYGAGAATNPDRTPARLRT